MRQWNKPDFKDPRLAKARTFALAAHAAVGQFRKYSVNDQGKPLPYIVHPDECVGILQWLPESSGITIQQLIAMELHDVVEDTRWFADENGHRVSEPSKHIKSGRPVFLREGITFELVYSEFNFGDPAFGADVVRILSGLTDVSMPWDGNRTDRKALDLAHTAQQAADVKTDKLADLISNAPSIIEFGEGFAWKWMKEKAALLDVLKDGGDPILWDIAKEMSDTFFKSKHNQAS
jgi:hypothetical protein